MNHHSLLQKLKRWNVETASFAQAKRRCRSQWQVKMTTAAKEPKEEEEEEEQDDRLDSFKADLFDWLGLRNSWATTKIKTWLVWVFYFGGDEILPNYIGSNNNQYSGSRRVFFVAQLEQIPSPLLIPITFQGTSPQIPYQSAGIFWVNHDFHRFLQDNVFKVNMVIINPWLTTVVSFLISGD